MTLAIEEVICHVTIQKPVLRTSKEELHWIFNGLSGALETRSNWKLYWIWVH